MGDQPGKCRAARMVSLRLACSVLARRRLTPEIATVINSLQPVICALLEFIGEAGADRDADQ